MSMDYGTAFIGIKTKDGKLKKYSYGYDNEIVPDLVVSPEWKSLFDNPSTREELLSGSFQDRWDDNSTLKVAVEEFDYDGSGIKEYNKFINSVKKIKTGDVDLIALGVVHGGKGFYSYDWNILDFNSGFIESKRWENNEDSYNGPGEECIEEAINKE